MELLFSRKERSNNGGHGSLAKLATMPSDVGRKIMMRLTSSILILAIGITLIGCASNQPNYHVLTLDQQFDHIIKDPYDWTLQQFADGPIDGPHISEYAGIVLAHGLKQSLTDLTGDGTQELLLRDDCPARVHEVMVFLSVKSGYRYLGHFSASFLVTDSDRLSLLVYESCGGHNGVIKSYKHDGNRFVCSSTEEISVGDGAPEQNNHRLDVLFPKDRVIQWTKTPNKMPEDTARKLADPQH
jgi:hypothetical protein